MTLEVLLQLMDIASSRKKNAGDDKKNITFDTKTPDSHLRELINMLSSEENHSDVISPLIHRLTILSAAQSDPAKAEALLIANLPKEEETWPLLDFSAWPQVRYALSGEVQTPESEAYFSKVTSAANILRAALLDSEHARSAPTFTILDKLLNLNSALPERYKKMANIPYS
ncbi:hypothetical protein [Enterobacter sp. UNJFSC 003]|uniref:hypothetical protein n=1 Tax=Enterobacter sp. UNJFSC 003 TaxID=3122077 RepID=UPI002EADDE8E|nr:hypothetical protein [Serratia liquefaciens]